MRLMNRSREELVSVLKKRQQQQQPGRKTSSRLVFISRLLMLCSIAAAAVLLSSSPKDTGRHKMIRFSDRPEGLKHTVVGQNEKGKELSMSELHDTQNEDFIQYTLFRTESSYSGYIYLDWILPSDDFDYINYKALESLLST